MPGRSAGPGKGSEYRRVADFAGKARHRSRGAVFGQIVELSVLRILLIDDNSDANEALATLLALCGQEVRAALDGPTALEIATELKPQVVICDLGLPGMDGYQVLRQLREQSGETMPISFALTAGYGRDEDRGMSRGGGLRWAPGELD